MEFIFDPMYAINLALCIIIFVLGYSGFKKKKGDKVPLYIGMGFGLFGISHLATILNLKNFLGSLLILIRLFGYLMVIVALYTYWKRK